MANEFLDFNGLSRYTSKIVERFKSFVPVSRMINGKPLSGDIKLTASDVGAQVSGSYATTSQLNSYVPTNREINSKSLTQDITLGANDIRFSDGQTFQQKYNSGQLTGPKGDKGSDASISYPISIANGGTGSNTAPSALKNLTNINSLALGSNSTASGDCSIGIGSNAFTDKANTIAIGTNAQCSSIRTIAIGYAAKSNGANGVVLGYSASAEKSQSISIGYSSATSGNNAISLGYGTNVAADNSVAIGQKAIISSTSPDTIQLGNSSTLSKLQCAVQLTISSDKRDKTDIEPIEDKAVDFLQKIKAVRYVRNRRELYIDEETLSKKDLNNKYTYGLCVYDKEAHTRGDKKGKRIRVGVLAQEVQEALKEVYGDQSYGNLVDDNFYDLDPSTIPEDVENQLSINYEGFIPFLIKAIQEQQEQIESNQHLIQGLQNENARLTDRLSALEHRL